MAKNYSVGLVGEANYQSAIQDLREGEHIALRPEPGNPHDPRAIVAEDGEGRTIGYVSRDHWLTEAMLDQGKGVKATVERVEGGDAGRPSLGVVLRVELTNDVEAASPIQAAAMKRILDKNGERIAASVPAGDDETTARNKKIGKGCGCALLAFVGLSIIVGIAGDPVTEGDAAPASDATMSVSDEDAVIAWYDGIMDAGAPCDAASKRMGEITIAISEGNASMFDGYGAAQRTQAACRESSMAVGGVSIPAAFEGELEDQAEEARDTCQLAYAARQQSAEAAMEVFDGDMRPSKMSTMTELAQQGSNGIMACVAQTMQVVDAAGVDIARLQAE